MFRFILILSGLLLLGGCALSDSEETAAGGALMVSDGRPLSNPDLDEACIGIVANNGTNVLYYSQGEKGIFRCTQKNGDIYNPPVFVPGTAGCVSFAPYMHTNGEWLFVTLTNGKMAGIKTGSSNVKQVTFEMPGGPSTVVCVIPPGGSFANLTVENEEIALVFAEYGTNLRATRIPFTYLQDIEGDFQNTSIVMLTTTAQPVLGGGSFVPKGTLGMSRDSILYARNTATRGSDIFLSDLAGTEKALTAFTSIRDDASPVYNQADKCLYMTSKAFAPEYGDRSFNIFRWNSRTLSGNDAYNPAASELAWAVSLGGAKREDIAGIVTLDDGYILSGRTDSAGAGGDDVFVAKLGKSGRLLWVKTFGTADGHEVPGMLVKNGSTLSIAGTRTVGTTSTAFILTLDLEGAVQSTHILVDQSGGNIEINGGCLRSDGKLGLVGNHMPTGQPRRLLALTVPAIINGEVSAFSYGNATNSLLGLTVTEGQNAFGQNVLVAGGRADSAGLIVADAGSASSADHVVYASPQTTVMTAGYLPGSTLFAIAGSTASGGFVMQYPNTSNPGAAQGKSFSPEGIGALFLTSDSMYFAAHGGSAVLGTIPGAGDTSVNGTQYGLAGGDEQHPRLTAAIFNPVYPVLAVQTLASGNNDILIIKGDGQGQPNMASATCTLGTDWTSKLTSGPTFGSRAGIVQSAITVNATPAVWTTTSHNTNPGPITTKILF